VFSFEYTIMNPPESKPIFFPQAVEVFHILSPVCEALAQPKAVSLFLYQQPADKQQVSTLTKQHSQKPLTKAPQLRSES
jgi:hypothetical protein